MICADCGKESCESCSAVFAAAFVKARAKSEQWRRTVERTPINALVTGDESAHAAFGAALLSDQASGKVHAPKTSEEHISND